MNKQSLVKTFMYTFNQTVRTTPTIPPTDEAHLRMRLISEEFQELIKAIYAGDIVEVADALADILYVVYGTCNTLGIDIDPIFNEVHRSNMTKVGGEIDKNGKVQKPSDYSPPELLPFLLGQVKNV